jgi:pimeloyl-ACP methyl ester carboxylesterase
VKLEVLSRQASQDSGLPPLLFVHGSGHAAWSWDEHFLSWFAAQGFNTWAVSLRGHGKSEGAERLRWTSIAAYVDDVRRVAVTLPSEPVLIGHSLGGLIVQKYLERYDVRGAVLLAPSPARGMFLQGIRLFLGNPLLFARVYATLEPGLVFSTRERARRFLFSREASDADIDRYVARLGRESFRAMLGMAFNLPRVRKIRQRACPMLVLGGGADTLVPPSEVEGTARAYGAPCTIFPGMGHDLMLEPHWQRVAERMREWFGAGQVRS